MRAVNICRHIGRMAPPILLSMVLIFFHWAVKTPAIAGTGFAARSSFAKNDLPEPTGSPIREKLFTTGGGLGYAQFCAGCHGEDGAGVKGIFPPLAPKTAVAVSGAPAKATAQFYTMPSFSQLSDRELAEILNFVRKSWGSDSAPEVRGFRENFGEKAADSSGFQVPRLADLLARPNAAQLIRGVRLLLETKALLPENVGNALNCSSCHLEAGTVPFASPFTGVLASFPGYSPRAGRIITIEERINGCFLRSMNGKPLPVDSADMKAMVAYFTWLKPEAGSQGKAPGRGVGKISISVRPDIQNGKKIYLAQCAACHGKVGEGHLDARSRYVYPPLWGDKAFNLGAGLARTYTAAAFTKNNMPIGVRENFPLGQGGLSDQEAVDVAGYFSHQPRPDFPMKANDWPKGGKPVDSRY